MSDPFARSIRSIPVSVVNGPVSAKDERTAVITAPAARDHVHGTSALCPACMAGGDLRAMLFDLLHQSRQGLRPPLSRVVVVAQTQAERDAAIDVLSGGVAAMALRDHTVARSFHLAIR